MMIVSSKEEREMGKKLDPYIDWMTDEFRVKDDSPEEIKKLTEEFKTKYIDNNPVPEGWG